MRETPMESAELLSSRLPMWYFLWYRWLLFVVPAARNRRSLDQAVHSLTRRSQHPGHNHRLSKKALAIVVDQAYNLK
jgi:hypothetical protein